MFENEITVDHAARQVIPQSQGEAEAIESLRHEHAEVVPPEGLIVEPGLVFHLADEQAREDGFIDARARREYFIAAFATLCFSTTTSYSALIALSLILQHLSQPWQIVRLALKVAGSDDEIRVAATPYAVAVTMALHDLAQLTSELREEIRRGHYGSVGEKLKQIHDGVRGLRTELDLRSDSTWGKQLAAIRVEISNAVKSEIESVPGRVRRLLRQRLRWQPAREPPSPRGTPTGVVVLIDRCLGLGDVLMLSAFVGWGLSAGLGLPFWVALLLPLWLG